MVRARSFFGVAHVRNKIFVVHPHYRWTGKIIQEQQANMASKFSKRGKNPGAVDSWLDSLGYYRKNVAYDETCLFRAIAEQMFYSQLYHERVRKECIAYGKKHSKEFKQQVPKKREWYERLKKLSVHMLICTDVEIQLISKTYDVDITIFNAADRSVQEFKCHALYKGYRHLLICKMSDDHFDTVYNKEYIANAGFCQSIVYKLLYEEVFDIPDVTSIVNGMLHDKQSSYSLYLSEGSPVKSEYSDNDEGETSDDFMLQSSLLVQQNALAPFPFKVAKALDPNMYRNIEYDTWLEVRRALRLGDWYYGDDKLILGTRCMLHLEGENFLCYIQEILKEEDRCIVYVTKLAERWTVRYSDLRPEDDAKPWPLPYRFARNLPIPSPNDNAVSDSDRKTLRKRREKKRLNSLDNNNSQAEPRDANANVPDLNIINYEGCALHMQEPMNAAVLVDKMNTKVKVSSGSEYPIEAGEEWNLSNATGSESISVSWLPTSTSQQVGSGFDNSSMTPPTSSSVGYRESNNNVPLYYNCSPEYAYSSVPIWSQPHYIVSPDPGISLSDNDNSPPLDSSRNSQNYVYYQHESAYGSPTFLSPSLPTPPPTFTPYTFAYNDKFICSTPVTPVSPHMDVYPFMYPVPPPGTPMLYSHPPPPPAPPAAPTAPLMAPLGSPMPLYNTPNELQCVNSPTYMYPPLTPPVTWYPPPSINAQGFIFPPPLNPPTNVPM